MHLSSKGFRGIIAVVSLVMGFCLVAQTASATVNYYWWKQSTAQPGFTVSAYIGADIVERGNFVADWGDVVVDFRMDYEWIDPNGSGTQYIRHADLSDIVDVYNFADMVFNDGEFSSLPTTGVTFQNLAGANQFVVNIQAYPFISDELLVNPRAGAISLENGFYSGRGSWVRGKAPVLPEPSTMILLGSGLCGIAGVAWRRRKELLP